MPSKAQEQGTGTEERKKVLPLTRDCHVICTFSETGQDKGKIIKTKGVLAKIAYNIMLNFSNNGY